MHRIIRMAEVCLLAVICLSGCEKKQSLSADTSTIIIKENGSFVGYVSEAFDETLYSFEDLQALIGSKIEAYNTEAGKEAVVLDKSELLDGKINLSITYRSAEDYQAFNNEIFFYGTIREAVAAGYDLTKLQMMDASDQENVIGKAELETIPDSYIVITEDPSNIRGYAKIAYLEPEDTLVNAYEVLLAEQEPKNDADVILHCVIFK